LSETPRRLSFGAHADAYDRARPEWPEEVARWLVPEDARLVVELGAGTGKLTRAIAALGARVVAVEPDERMRTVLEERGLGGVSGSAEEIPLADGEADVVVAGSCLHWFDLDRALPEIRRVLCPGGRFAFGWNHRDTDDPRGARMQELMSAARGGFPGWRAREWAAAVTEGGYFGEVERATFRHVHELPRDALGDHLVSFSGIGALSDEDLAELTAAVAAALGDGDPVRLPSVVDAFRTVAA
jgi:SAM-dependent methyltransferase